jgi:hypothetical protein
MVGRMSWAHGLDDTSFIYPGQGMIEFARSSRGKLTVPLPHVHDELNQAWFPFQNFQEERQDSWVVAGGYYIQER